MEFETKVCQNCQTDFTIEPDDFGFYEKIGVPAPTFCPECRTVRRLCWRNEMSFYKRKCDALNHNENLISIYHPDERLTVYDYKQWWSDDWDSLDYGQDYNFSKPFFLQWKDLMSTIPLQCLSNSKATNSDYCNVAEESRDSYMSSGSWKIERTFYSNRVLDIKDSSDLYIGDNLELCYEDVLCTDCFRIFYSINCKSCVDSYFLYDCRGCTSCFGCTNLRNKSYYMWNKQLSKEEYEKKISEINLKSNETVSKLKEKFKDLCSNSIHRFSNQIKTFNSTGDNLEEAKNCKNCFDIKKDVENSKFVHWGGRNLKEGYDSGPGVGDAELVYEVFDTGIGNFRNLFTSVVYSSSNIEYCFNCYGSSYLFGCIGLRNKNYCILNKQYTKEEYFKIVEKIKKQMKDIPYIDKKGVKYGYGEFFPSELSPFCYNETQAQDYFPLTKEEAVSKGYRWREKKKPQYQATIKAKDLPNNLDDVKESITKEIISCLHEGKCEDRCAEVYKITQEELNLYRRLKVPLPRLCFLCRHENRLRMRNPMKLWKRTCMKEGCNNEFETSYAPERPEIIYCEKCYQSEVI